MNASFYEPRHKDGKVVALADVDLAGGVVVKGFRVVRGERGLFAAVPSRALTVEGQIRYYNQVTFASSDLRERFLRSLLEAYRQWERERASGGPGEASSHPPADELVE